MSAPFKVILAILAAFVALVVYNGFKHNDAAITIAASGNQSSAAPSRQTEQQAPPSGNASLYPTPDEFIAAWNNNAADLIKINNPFTLQSGFRMEAAEATINIGQFPHTVMYSKGCPNCEVLTGEGVTDAGIYRGSHYRFCAMTPSFARNNLSDTEATSVMTRFNAHLFITLVYRGEGQFNGERDEYMKNIIVPYLNSKPHSDYIHHQVDYKGWRWSVSLNSLCASPLDV